MAGGGTAILPMNDEDAGLLPDRLISVWSYTDCQISGWYSTNQIL